MPFGALLRGILSAGEALPQGLDAGIEQRQKEKEANDRIALQRVGLDLEKLGLEQKQREHIDRLDLEKMQFEQKQREHTASQKQHEEDKFVAVPESELPESVRGQYTPGDAPGTRRVPRTLVDPHFRRAAEERAQASQREIQDKIKKGLAPIEEPDPLLDDAERQKSHMPKPTTRPKTYSEALKALRDAGVLPKVIKETLDLEFPEGQNNIPRPEGPAAVNNAPDSFNSEADRVAGAMFGRSFKRLSQSEMQQVQKEMQRQKLEAADARAQDNHARKMNQQLGTESGLWVSIDTLENPPPTTTRGEVQNSGKYVSATPQQAAKAGPFRVAMDGVATAREIIDRRPDLFPKPTGNALKDAANVKIAQAKYQALKLAGTDTDIATLETLVGVLPTYVRSFGDVGNIADREREAAKEAFTIVNGGTSDVVHQRLNVLEKGLRAGYSLGKHYTPGGAGTPRFTDRREDQGKPGKPKAQSPQQQSQTPAPVAPKGNQPPRQTAPGSNPPGGKVQKWGRDKKGEPVRIQ